MEKFLNGKSLKVKLHNNQNLIIRKIIISKEVKEDNTIKETTTKNSLKRTKTTKIKNKIKSNKNQKHDELT